MDSYAQTVVVQFRSEAAANAAHLHIAPLYHDLKAAFSTRMDDSNLNDLMVAQVLEKFGQKGTFYLNNPESWWQDNPATGIKAPKNPGLEIPQRLLSGGHSLGGHTLNHEYLPVLSKNAAFKEIMGIRVAIEAHASSPCISFTYPFVSYIETGLRNASERADLEEILRRAGYFQLAEHRYNADWDSGLQDAVFITVDNSGDEGTYSESVLTAPLPPSERPLFLVTMHALVSAWGAPDFPLLSDLERRWASRPDWWYCNQSQYAAYRYQALHSRLSVFVEGSTLRAVLTRPDALDLGDPVPLTLLVEGCHPEDVLSVTASAAVTEPVKIGPSYSFDLFHDTRRGSIGAFHESSNPTNTDQLGHGEAGPEGLQALLFHRGERLTLILKNSGGCNLSDIRVVFRLPLRWKTGVVRESLRDLEKGASTQVQIQLSEREDSGHFCDGSEYDVAQIDYRGSERARVYATCETAAEAPASSFARDAFWILGPLAGDEPDFDPLAFSSALLSGAKPEREYAVHWSGRLSWRTLDPARASILDPDIIPTTGRSNIPSFYVWDPAIYSPHKRVHYLLYGRVLSPFERNVRAVYRKDCVRSLSVNGRVVDGGEFPLHKGENTICILYAPAPGIGSTFSPANYGCYFRLASREGRPLEDVTFERPPVP